MERFQSMLITLNIFMDPELIPVAFHACNASHNGTISFNEFWQVLALTFSHTIIPHTP